MFQKGNTHGTGRPKGSKNKTTDQIKESFALLLENKLQDLEEWLERTAEDDPGRAIDMIIKISERFVPKLSSTALTNADGGSIWEGVKFKFGELSSKDDKKE